MDINVKVKQNLAIRAFYLFFIMESIIIGIGIMGSPMYIYNEARQDAWVSILITYVYVLLVLFAMFLILKQYKNADILGIQVDVFGRWIGKLLGTIYMVHFAVTLLIIFVTYIEVVQIFVFPEISPFLMGGLLLILIVSSVLGGLRVIVGVAFLFFFLSHWLLFLLYDPVTQMELDNFRPFLGASIPDLLRGAKKASFTFLGFEILFFVYPFIQNKQQAKRPVFLGVTFAAFLVLLDTCIAIGFYSPGLLEQLEWSVLMLYKSVHLPFINRMDYIVIAEWMMVVLPNMVLLMWVLTFGMKRIYNIQKKVTLYAMATFLFVASGFIKYHSYIINLTDTYSEISFWLVYVYPFILLPLVWLKKRRKKAGKGLKKK